MESLHKRGLYLLTN